MTIVSPYQRLPSKNFWKAGVSKTSLPYVDNIYTPKFQLTESTRVASAGSCFAQHISKNLRNCNIPYLDVEPAPLGLPEENAKKYGYGLFSARYGNIYTVRQMLQLVQEVLGEFSPQNCIWERNGRLFDALRLGVEPEGLSSRDEVVALRKDHLSKLAELFSRTDVLIFTLGLTEAWVDKVSGTVYSTAPGTIAGAYSPDDFKFVNFTFQEIVNDFMILRKLLWQNFKRFHFILTVSPVPLTATATDNHVLVANTYSKSILRAAAGHLTNLPDVDYFPSFELIANPFLSKNLYEDNLRRVCHEGVDVAMKTFCESHNIDRSMTNGLSQEYYQNDVECEELLLETFMK